MNLNRMLYVVKLVEKEKKETRKGRRKERRKKRGRGRGGDLLKHPSCN